MTQDANIGRILEGKYKLVRILGTGGMGTVYEATHLLIKRRLAVKLLHAEYAKEELFATRFKREAQTASAIGHDHIVEITDMGTTEEGELFIVMEYLEGADLATLLKKHPSMPSKRACHIMIQMLSALEAAHAKGIVHRDLKPANIFIINHQESIDYVKLVDFGISKIRQDGSERSLSLTKTGELLGTPSFMSPEQARGELNIDGKADIFSAGVILYTLLTGMVPFEDKALTMLLFKIMNDTPPHPSDVNPRIPKSLGDAVIKAMEKDPAKRFKDAAAFRRVLQRFSPDTPSRTGLSVTHYRQSAIPYPQGGAPPSEGTPLQLVLSDNGRPNRRKKTVGIALAVMTVAAIFGIIIYYQTETKFAKISTPQVVPIINTGKTEPAIETRDAPPERPKALSIKLAVTPEHAEVRLDGHKVGTGAMEHTVAADHKPHEIVVSAPGYVTYQNLVVFSEDIAMDITLAKATGEEKDGESSRRHHHRRNRHRSEAEAVSPVAQEPHQDRHAGEAGQPAPVPGPETHSDAEVNPNPPIRRYPRDIDEVNPWSRPN